MSDQNKLTAEEMRQRLLYAYHGKQQYLFNTKITTKITLKEHMNPVVTEVHKIISEQTAEKDARIKELEEQRDKIILVGWGDKQLSMSKCAEITGEKIDDIRRRLAQGVIASETDVYKELVDKNISLTKELEAVKKEREGLGRLQQFHAAEWSKAEAQRDEAVNLLEVYQKCALEGLTLPAQVIKDSIAILSRLSSGETKPEEMNCVCGHESPLISVEDRLPEKRKQKVDYYHLGEYKQGYFVRKFKMNTGFFSYRFADNAKEIDPTKMHPASHWTPLPAPPESLTDKK